MSVFIQKPDKNLQLGTTIEIKNIKATQAQSEQCKIPSDGVPIGRQRYSWEFFGTTWSNKSDAQPPEGDYMKFVLICLNTESVAESITELFAESIAESITQSFTELIFKSFIEWIDC